MPVAIAPANSQRPTPMNFSGATPEHKGCENDECERAEGNGPAVEDLDIVHCSKYIIDAHVKGPLTMLS